MPAEAAWGAGLFVRVGERANPVLVKEVRSALRGRAFALGFSFVLLLAVIVSTFALVVGTLGGDPGPSGGEYLGAVSVVFGLGAFGLVPFSAMASMAAEHDEGAIEMLAMSGISPGRLVLGKLGAAAVQASLVYAAFLPFLAFGFLLQGVDLGWLTAGVAGSFAGSIAYASLGILLGATLTARWMRVVGYVLLAILLLLGLQLVGVLVFALGVVGTPSAVQNSALACFGCALFSALCCIGAASRLQHQEENHSTPFRVLGTAALVVVATWGALRGSPRETFAWLVGALAIATPSMLLAVTEAARLPRAVLARARRREGSVLALPWLPGGGRGVLLVLANLALVLLAAGAAVLLGGGSRPEGLRVLGALAAIEAWLLVVLLLPAGLVSPWLGLAWLRALARIGILILPLAALLLPALGAFLLGSPGDPFDQPANPAYFARRILEHGTVGESGPFGLLWLAVVLALLVNVPRVVASLLEVPRERARCPAPRSGAGDAAPVR
ncbi:MAG: ABC transporter permease [Planctomycetes bacterium]|nr:ABC transporter permease [Planctomycetota bacterium]